MSDVGANLGQFGAERGGIEPVTGYVPATGPNWTSAAADRIAHQGRGDRSRERRYPTWKRDRAEMIAALGEMRSEIAQLREQVRALRAMVQGRQDTAAARERLIWMRGRLQEAHKQN